MLKRRLDSRRLKSSDKKKKMKKKGKYYNESGQWIKQEEIITKN